MLFYVDRQYDKGDGCKLYNENDHPFSCRLSGSVFQMFSIDLDSLKSFLFYLIAYVLYS